MLAFGPENAQSLVGVALVLAICWAVSENRRRFPWKLAIGAILVQAILVLDGAMDCTCSEAETAPHRVSTDQRSAQGAHGGRGWYTPNEQHMYTHIQREKTRERETRGRKTGPNTTWGATLPWATKHVAAPATRAPHEQFQTK